MIPMTTSSHSSFLQQAMLWSGDEVINSADASKRLIRAIKDPGYTKSEHSSDIIMVLTSQKITKMP